MINKETKLNKITRVEIIDNEWRQYVNMNCENVELLYQDNNRTLKIFLNNKYAKNYISKNN